VRYLYPSTTSKKERLRKGRAIGEMRSLIGQAPCSMYPPLAKRRRQTKPSFLWLHFRAFYDWDVNNRKSEFKVKKKKKKKKKKNRRKRKLRK
jgi:hypothetical protein